MQAANYDFNMFSDDESSVKLNGKVQPTAWVTDTYQIRDTFHMHATAIQ